MKPHTLPPTTVLVLSTGTYSQSCASRAFSHVSQAFEPRPNYGKPSDVWAIGCVAFYMLSGYPPFDGDTGQRGCANAGH